MPEVIDLVIPGLPVAKKRHRAANGRTYNPQSEVERAVQWEIRQLLGPEFQQTEKPLILSVDAFFPRPKLHYGTGRNSSTLKKSAPPFHVKKPDHDNIIKFYMDCMSKLVFVDDIQVVGFAACGKHWVDKDEPGHVVIRLIEARPSSEWGF